MVCKQAECFDFSHLRLVWLVGERRGAKQTLEACSQSGLNILAPAPLTEFKHFIIVLPVSEQLVVGKAHYSQCWHC